jgi:hypothetical protein
LPGFFHQSAFEHDERALVNARIERVAIRVQAEAQNGEALEWIAAFTPHLGHLPARAEADLDGANQLGRVVRMNLLRCGRVKTTQDFVQVRGILLRRPLAQPFAQFFRALRAREQAFEQRAQVEARASDHDGHVAARFDVF